MNKESRNEAIFRANIVLIVVSVSVVLMIRKYTK